MNAFDVDRALFSAVEFLEYRHLAYAVIGGMALAQWGVVRATLDVDFKIAVPDTDYAAVRDLLVRRFPLPGRPDLPTNPLIVSVDADGVIVDFLLALPGYDSGVVDRAIRKSYKGHEIRFCSAEDLIILKAVAARPRDWLDIEGLVEAQRSRLNLDFIRDWSDQFAEALERPEISDRLRTYFR